MQIKALLAATNLSALTLRPSNESNMMLDTETPDLGTEMPAYVTTDTRSSTIKCMQVSKWGNSIA